MNASNKLLDKYAEMCKASTDSDVAARLRVSKQAVSGWRNGKAHPNAEAIETMCKATGESLAHWLPLIEADRSRTAGDRRAWLRLAQIAAAVLIAVGVAPTHARADSAARNPSSLYIM